MKSYYPVITSSKGDYSKQHIRVGPGEQSLRFNILDVAYKTLVYHYTKKSYNKSKI